MISITRVFHFEAAHHLPYHLGKCKNVHGHSYRVEVTVANEYGLCQEEGEPNYGMVIDFKELNALVQPVIDTRFDHKDLNETLDGLYPTAENIAKFLAEAIQTMIDLEGYRETRVESVKVWETNDSYAIWTR